MTPRQPASRTRRTPCVQALACLLLVLGSAPHAVAAVLPMRGMSPTTEAVQTAAPAEAPATPSGSGRDAQPSGSDTAGTSSPAATAAWGTASVAALGAAVTFIFRKR